MSRIVSLVAALLLCAAAPVAAEDAKPADDQKTLYQLGRLVARSLEGYSLKPDEAETLVSGVRDGLTGKGEEINLDEARTSAQNLFRTRVAATQKEKGAAFAAKEAGEAGAVKTSSGLVYRELTAGAGDGPKAEDTVEVHYTGSLTDGTVFDSSVQRGTPATFQLTGVVPCFREGIQSMKPGGKARLVCPADIAYGDRGFGEAILPGSTLVFEVELLRIVK